MVPLRWVRGLWTLVVDRELSRIRCRGVLWVPFVSLTFVEDLRLVKKYWPPVTRVDPEDGSLTLSLSRGGHLPVLPGVPRQGGSGPLTSLDVPGDERPHGVRRVPPRLCGQRREQWAKVDGEETPRRGQWTTVLCSVHLVSTLPTTTSCRRNRVSRWQGSRRGSGPRGFTIDDGSLQGYTTQYIRRGV